MRGINEFEDLVEHCYSGNRYAASMYVAKEARRRATNCKDDVLDSESISWVLTGKRNIPARSTQKKIQKWFHNQYDILNYVEDECVKRSVTRSLGISKTVKHLTYAYEKSLSECDKARVRVLTNILWYQSKEVKNHGRNVYKND